MEIGVGAGALLVEPILLATGKSYAFLSASLHERPSLLVTVDILLAIVAVFPATFLMGGSLPLLGEAFAARRESLGVKAGGLYAANTLGAAAGALAVPIALLPLLGAVRAGLVAVAGSILVGITAWLIDAVGAHHVAPRHAMTGLPSGTKTDPAVASASASFPKRVVLLGFQSGLLTLSFETLAVRMLAQVHENSIQAFSMVLTIFLVSLASGAAVARALIRRRAQVHLLLGVTWMAAGAFLLTTPRVFLWASDGMSYVPGAMWGLGGSRIVGIALVSLAPAAMLYGCVLPSLMEIAGKASREHAGPALGWLLGANTLGAIVGPLVATFLLQPLAGLWWGMTLVGVATVAIAEQVMSREGRRVSVRLLLYAALGMSVLVLRPSDVPRVKLAPGEKLVWLSEEAFATVAVVESQGQRRIKLDNSYLIGGTASIGEERLQAHLPLLLHPAPRRVAFLGMGTGISAGASLLHPVERITIVEIVPGVVLAARNHFQESSLGVAADPRVEVVLEDARRWLASSGRKFDVIVGDLFVPWRRGESALFTREQFESARRALAPDGIFCQWVPMYQMSEEEFRIVLHTFVEVFPVATLWHGDLRPGEPAVGLVGRADGTLLKPAAADDRSRQLARRIDPINPYLSDPAGLWLYLIGVVDPRDPWIAGARINSDDRPWIELGAAQARGASGTGRETVVGRSATAILDRLAGGPQDGSLGDLLGVERLRWRAVGRRLWEASLLAMDGREDEADAIGLQALHSLPAAIQRATIGHVESEPECAVPLTQP